LGVKTENEPKQNPNHDIHIRGNHWMYDKDKGRTGKLDTKESRVGENFTL